MRLDKYISHTTALSRSDATKAIRAGRIAIEGEQGCAVSRAPDTKVDPEADIITLDGGRLIYKKYIYIMLNKPEGVVSATEDPSERTVLDLLPEEYQNKGLFPCGRLDKNTVGLVILTNDGPLAHRLLAPKSHATKIYRFNAKFPISEQDVELLEGGVDIGGYTTAPCKVELNEDKKSGEITLTEGKYHQIKLMLGAVHNQITFLERIEFAGIRLDETLARGEWREIIMHYAL